MDCAQRNPHIRWNPQNGICAIEFIHGTRTMESARRNLLNGIRSIAKSALEAGLTDKEIQNFWPWKSDSYRLYIERTSSTRHDDTNASCTSSRRDFAPPETTRFPALLCGCWGASGVEVLLAFGPPLGPSLAQRLQ